MRIKANGITLNYEMEGPEDGPVVTLSHSLSTNLAQWDPQVPALRDRYRVLRYDCRGHGGSEAPEGPYDLRMLAEDVVGLLDALDIGRTHFVGLSMGGMIGQVLGLEYPERLHSLVLASTTSRIPAEGREMWDERIRIAETQGMAAHVEPTIERWFTPEFIPENGDVVDRVRGWIADTPVAGYVGWGRAIQGLDLTDRLGAIDVPALVMVGRDDPGTPVAAAETIHGGIPGAHLVVLDDASHQCGLQRPGAFNRELRGFLDHHTGDPGP